MFRLPLKLQFLFSEVFGVVEKAFRKCQLVLEVRYLFLILTTRFVSFGNVGRMALGRILMFDDESFDTLFLRVVLLDKQLPFPIAEARKVRQLRGFSGLDD